MTVAPPEIPVCHVPAGTYRNGDDGLSPENRPAYDVELNAFYIGQTAVTNAQYATFIKAGGYKNLDHWGEMGGRWQKHKQARFPAFFHDPAFNHPFQPVVGVCWYEAMAFSNWLAAESGERWRLLTEEQWAAAAFPPDGDTQYKSETINTAELRIGSTWKATGRGQKSWCGALDMLGNVWEWTLTRWGRNWQTCEYGYPLTAESHDPTGSQARVMRGGSWYDGRDQAHPARRGRYLPGSRGSNIGFRVAKSV